MLKRKKIWGDTAKALGVDFALLAISFMASLTVAPLFLLPFRNPDNISNPFNSIAYNPSNNYYQIVFIIVATLGVFWLSKKAYMSGYAWVVKLLISFVLLSNFFFFYAANIAQGYPYEIIYANGAHTMDNFHSGEQLAPASAFLSGRSPYDEIFFLRGAGVDVLVPSLGFALFGKSIGGFLLVNHILMLVTMAGFFALLAYLVRGALLYSATITLFYISDALSLVQIRDIPVWVCLGLVVYIFSRTVTQKKKSVAMVALGLLASLELYIAIDKGILLVILALLTAMCLTVFQSNKRNEYTFNPRSWKQNFRIGVYIIAGLVAGFVLPALALGWDSFVAFFAMTFIEIPKYGTLLVSTKFPPLFTSEYLIWGAVVIAVATGFLLIRLFEIRKPRDLNVLIPYVLIFIFALLVIKAGANRIHILKMAQIIAPMFLIAAVTFLYGVRTAHAHKSTRVLLIPPLVLVAIAILGFAQLNMSKVLRQPSYTRHQLVDYSNLPDKPDGYWITDQTRAVADEITLTTNKDDGLFVFPANPSYYYLTGRQNPTRFYISWFADPQPYSDELLSDLKQTPPRAVLYKDASWMDAPDGIPMEARLPEVAEWIKINYPHEKKVGDAIILTRDK